MLCREKRAGYYQPEAKNTTRIYQTWEKEENQVNKNLTFIGIRYSIF